MIFLKIFMIVNYSENTNELELSGNKDELISLSKNLLENDVEIFLHSEGIDPSPYSKCLKKIKVNIINNHLVELQVTDSSLFIRGSYEKLFIFAENIKNFGNDGDKGDHVHIEYFDEHFYLSSKSNSLVILHL